ncbi:histidine phosphatase superfamily [Boeremia exigua]|uniref:histidine phosphatase superfamily n=1 Tax=Boeremia exigua TaxID=749465 RepID=UPI001E8DCACE|nr:histidine phosphatase superfamily [Boeremia exigua]KAH6633262.1 histidine phosphatase superfamily [Boeremia exigua]
MIEPSSVGTPCTRRKYIALRGFFSHDDDPESWDFRATTRVNLGLLDRSYPTDGEADLNSKDENKHYKLLYLIRHGEGFHNVKEKEVGRAEWDRHWAKVPGDGNVIWEDAELTANGEQQARNIAEARSSIGNGTITTILSSPLRCCLSTVQLAFPPEARDKKPVIKEKLREQLGVHTCDRRSSRSWIAEHYPSFDIEDGFDEEDTLWTPSRRETLKEHAIRSIELLDDIFESAYGDYIVLAAHSGTIMSLFAATGWKKVPVAAGAVYPLLVCGEKL